MLIRQTLLNWCMIIQKMHNWNKNWKVEDRLRNNRQGKGSRNKECIFIQDTNNLPLKTEIRMQDKIAMWLCEV